MKNKTQKYHTVSRERLWQGPAEVCPNRVRLGRRGVAASHFWPTCQVLTGREELTLPHLPAAAHARGRSALPCVVSR